MEHQFAITLPAKPPFFVAGCKDDARQDKLNIMKKISLVTVLCVALAGCAAMTTKQALHTWIGQPQSKLIELYGAPTGIYKVSENETVLTFASTGGTATAVPTSCRLNFTVVSGKVSKIAYQGDCHADGKHSMVQNAWQTPDTRETRK